MSQTPDYHEIEKNNQEQLMEVLRASMPEFHIVATMMQKLNINANLLFHVMSHSAQIANGTGYGQVHIVIEEGIVRFVRGEHSTRINEPVIKQLGDTVDNSHNSIIASP